MTSSPIHSALKTSSPIIIITPTKNTPISCQTGSTLRNLSKPPTQPCRPHPMPISSGDYHFLNQLAPRSPLKEEYKNRN
ncbi:hypothetical protein BDV39DRAFT_177775 [Aspergillus sergii]|uniref:Uncharacterized protein n=1 Tax=Aspergillus sergii TaxID=1034303 RepID=A0A5N6WZJ5_9EURO|nr:hypothetical protein BDV39DRAFT_177775 [Aspergillus sergii]